MTKKRNISAREKQRRDDQSRAQWEKDHPREVAAMERLSAMMYADDDRRQRQIRHNSG